MKYFYLLLTLLLPSCLSDIGTEPELNLNLASVERSTIQLTDSSKLFMNGIYKVVAGNELLGEEVAGKWVGNRWCLYSNIDVIFSENAGGFSGNQILFEGYIRIIRSGNGTTLRMSIKAEDGAGSLQKGVTPQSITLRGLTSDDKQIVLTRIRDLFYSNRRFQIIAHRGGGRNSERLGKSENSLELIKYAQILGATGIEIDVRPTRDRKLIIFHDDTFSPRTIQGAYLLGKVANFDLAQIKLFGTLIHGESIPTLDEALNTVIDSTLLSTVWLDVKDPSIVADVIDSQMKAIHKADSLGRTALKIYLGVPEQSILDSYLNCNGVKAAPILIEFSSSLASSIASCEVWAPRWTNGIPPLCSGKKIFVWTLDEHDYISDFIKSNNVDGILSNYPSLVSGMYYLGKPQ